MTTKQFKIGEYAVGGIIKVTIKGKLVQIEALDYFSKKQVSSGTCLSSDYDAYWKVQNYLNDLTTSYYTSKIMDWIVSKIILCND